MLILRLAFRNITGAGLRTWLNIFVLSIAFLAIIWVQGLLDGVNRQIRQNSIDTEVGGGQFRHVKFDPNDPLSIEDSHAVLPPELEKMFSKGQATPILMTSGVIYPEGRAHPALVKGIDPDQKIVNIPAGVLKSGDAEEISALIGARMAKQARLKKGDYVTLRWRDVNGTFDAADLRIVEIMSTNVPTIDSGQIWIPLSKMQTMMQAPNQATLVIIEQNLKPPPVSDKNWVFRDIDWLLKDVTAMMETKSKSSSIFYALLLGMALLTIFDTQVLSVFRRRREVGTLMALGMPRSNVIGLFTLEGALHGLLALVVGAVYGTPLLYLTAKHGLTMPVSGEMTGLAISNTMFPSYGLGLVAGTTLLVLATVTIVSFLPTRTISRLKPTDALRGRFSS